MAAHLMAGCAYQATAYPSPLRRLKLTFMYTLRFEGERLEEGDHFWSTSMLRIPPGHVTWRPAVFVPRVEVGPGCYQEADGRKRARLACIVQRPRARLVGVVERGAGGLCEE